MNFSRDFSFISTPNPGPSGTLRQPLFILIGLFKIEPSSELFINKAAIKYAFDVLKKDKNIIEYFEGDRKFYISEIENYKLAPADIPIIKDLT